MYILLYFWKNYLYSPKCKGLFKNNMLITAKPTNKKAPATIPIIYIPYIIANTNEAVK